MIYLLKFNFINKDNLILIIYKQVQFNKIISVKKIFQFQLI